MFRKYCLLLTHKDGKREIHFATSQKPLREIRSRTPKHIIASRIMPIRANSLDIASTARIRRVGSIWQ